MQIKKLAVLISFLIVLLLGTYIFMSIVIFETNPFPLAAKKSILPTVSSKEYKNTVFGFSLKYPSNLKYEIRNEQFYEVTESAPSHLPTPLPVSDNLALETIMEIIFKLPGEDEEIARVSVVKGEQANVSVIMDKRWQLYSQRDNLKIRTLALKRQKPTTLLFTGKRYSMKTPSKSFGELSEIIEKSLSVEL